MGIQNLLRFLKPFIKPIHIKKYSGKRVGIDAYSWLHKGAYSCSMELCLDLPGDASRRYIKYFMHHINLLRHHKIVPVVVFDGASIPCKSATEHERHRRRQTSLELAKEVLEQGNVTAAIDYFRKAISITPSMAYNLIQILNTECVEFIVAPYEADAQLAYLSTLDPDRGGIAAVITEDSDLIAYGCPACVFKMDRYGNGEEFILDRIFESVSVENPFKVFDREMLTGMCILAGCDFLPNIPGIGTKRAHSLVSKYKSLDRVLEVLKSDKRYKMPENYPEVFRKVLAVFHHARVYDLETQMLIHLNPLEEKHLEILNGDLDILGPDLSPPIAAAIAKGHLNPITMKAFDCLPKADICMDTGSSQAYDHLKTVDARRQFTEVSIFTVKEASKEKEDSEESCITIFTDEQSCEDNMLFDQSALDKKYMREASSFQRLIMPVQSPQLTEAGVDIRVAPNNNPFKKRKTEQSYSQNTQILTGQPLVSPSPSERSYSTCSLSESQESLYSKSNKPISDREESIHKKSQNQTNLIKTEKGSILNFFKRL